MPPSTSRVDGYNYDGHHGPDRTIAINVETMRLAMVSFVSRILSRVSVDTLRPVPMFLGLNPGAGFCLSAQAFTPPVKKVDKSTPEKIRSRVKTNFAFFLSNYALIAAMTAIVVALMHPGMVFFLIVIYLLWSLHSFLLRNQLVVFGIHVHALMTVQQRFYALFTLTLVVTIWKCLMPTLTFMAISGFIICTHAFLRDPKQIDCSHDSLDTADSDDVDEEAVIITDSGASSAPSEVIVDRPRSSASGSTSRRRGT